MDENINKNINRINKTEKESDIEKALRDTVREAGGRAFKWVSPGNRGVPDRVVVMPGGKVAFIELKAPGKKPTKLQLLQHKRLTSMGCRVYVVDGISQIRDVLKDINTGEIK